MKTEVDYRPNGVLLTQTISNPAGDKVLVSTLHLYYDELTSIYKQCAAYLKPALKNNSSNSEEGKEGEE